MSDAATFWEDVQRGAADECWPWLRYVDDTGYGKVRFGGTTRWAHRVAYELAVGPIPDGLWIDHVRDLGCTDNRCCNPAHLEPVSPRVNRLRGQLGEFGQRDPNECPQGHRYDKRNSRGDRICTACARDADARYRANKRKKVAA